MEIQFYCPRWGSEHIGWDTFLQTAKDAGYYGCELGIDRHITQSELDKIWNLGAKHGMALVPQQYDTNEADFISHQNAFAAWFKKIKPYPAPFINTQTGKDFFSLAQNALLIDVAERHAAQTGIPVYHETHRSKCLFAAHIAKDYFLALPSLQITFDVSHWICVASSWLHDQEEAVALACRHTAHIHARAGYTEGAQVPDPFVPEWQYALEMHLRWWDEIAARQQEAGKTLTITPECGAYPYMLYLPGTQQPVADQWQINLNMMNLLKQRYGA